MFFTSLNELKLIHEGVVDEEGEEEEVGSGFGREGVDVGRGGGVIFQFFNF